MRRKTLTTIMALIMAFLFIPCAVHAANDEVHYTGSGTFVECWEQAAASGGKIVLDMDAALTNECALSGSSAVVIDLNGHRINGSGTTNKVMFHLTGDSKLQIIDSSDSKNGSIEITETSGNYEKAFYIEDNATLTLTSGTLRGNDDPKSALVYVEDGNFNLSGGTVCGNTYGHSGAGVYVDGGNCTVNSGVIRDNASIGPSQSASIFAGGGVYISGGTFCMYGGEIRGNIATSHGAGVYADESSFYMTKGEIYGNHGDDSGILLGGGVYYDGSGSSSLRMTGGSIHDNDAKDGGGIFYDDGTGVISGGSIHDNTAIDGAAIYVNNGSDGIELTGRTLIKSNKASGDAAVTVRGEVILGGSVRIYGNSSADCHCLHGDGKVTINKDIDTTPESHAWIGLTTVTVGSDAELFDKYQDKYRNFYFYTDINDKDHSVCFFGENDGDGNHYSSLVMKDEEGRFNYVLSSKAADMQQIMLSRDALVDKDGEPLEEGADYTVDFDPVTLTYTINLAAGTQLGEASDLLKSDNDAVRSITLAKSLNDQASSEDSGLISKRYYYLCKYETSLEGRSYYRDAYYTVNMLVDGHKVSFVGAAAEDQYVADGDTAAEPPTPEQRWGYYFDGWYTDEGCTDEKKYDFDTPVTSDLTLYAKWTEKEVLGDHLVMFDFNGQDIIGYEDQSDMGSLVSHGELVEPPEMDMNPVDTRWQFAGWYTETECTNEFDFNTAIVDDLTLYARWIMPGAPEFTPPGAIENLKYTGEAQRLAYTGSTDEGTFYYVVSNSEKTPTDGWKTTIDKKSEAGIYYIHYFVKGDEDHIDSIPGCISAEILPADEEGRHVVSFYMNGHGTQIQYQAVDDGDKATRPTDPKADGFLFRDWYADKELNSRFDFDAPVTEDRTVYAKWVAEAPEGQFSAEFDMNGHGKDIRSQIINSGDKVTRPEDPYAEGYEFNGWYKDIACENAWNFDNDTVTGDTILYAKWVAVESVEQVSAEFNMNGHGEAIESQILNSGDKVTRPEDPYAEGYEFKGWYREFACENAWNFDNDTITEDTTLYAKWEKIAVTPLHVLTKVESRCASFTTEGNLEYWTCDICKGIFADDRAEVEISSGQTIIPRIDKSSISLSKTEYDGDGKAKKPSVSVSDVNGTALVEGRDFTVTYSNNIKPGTGLAKVQFIGRYDGSAEKKFTIRCVHTYSSKWSKNSEYHWHAATCEHKDLKSKRAKHSFKTSISKGIKTYTCKTCGYKKTKTLKVAVPKTYIRSLKKGKKSFTVKWKKKSVTGYQIQYATNSKFTKGKKTIKFKRASTVSKRVSKLKGKKKYYVRVRCYINKYGKTYYSSWSTRKAVTTYK